MTVSEGSARHTGYGGWGSYKSFKSGFTFDPAVALLPPLLLPPYPPRAMVFEGGLLQSYRDE